MKRHSRPDINLRAVAYAVRTLIGLAALALAAGAAWLLFATREEPPRVEHRENGIVVRVVEAVPTEVARTWEGHGTARATSVADVTVEVPGRVVQRPAHIEAGTRVRTGELLIALDPTEFEDRLERAAAAVLALQADIESLDVEAVSTEESLRLTRESIVLLERELERARTARQRGAATEAEVDRIERELSGVRREESEWRQRLNLIPTRRQRVQAQLHSERAASRLAELDLNRSRVTSPINGVLQEVDAHIGERVAPGQRVARVVNLDRIETPLRVAASALVELRVGDRVELRSEGARRREWTGRITRIAPEADPLTRSATVFAEVTQAPGDANPHADARELLLRGQFLVGRVLSSERRTHILAPRLAIDANRVMVVDEHGRAAAREVRVGWFIDGRFESLDPRETQWAVIESGLEPGDRIIVTNLDDLQVGALVDAVGVIERADAGEDPSGDPR